MFLANSVFKYKISNEVDNVNIYSKSLWPYCELVRIFLKMPFQWLALEVGAEALDLKDLFQSGRFYDFHVVLDGSVAEDN